MKIVVLDGHALNPGDLDWGELRRFGELKVYDRTPPEELLTRLEGVEIVFTNKMSLTPQIFDACPSIRYVGVLATGYNVVDIVAAKQRGIVVTNVPAYGTAAVAQFVFALLFELCLHVGAHSDSVHKGDWSRSIDFCYWNHPLVELAGKTLGIVGFGRIGQAVSEIAQALGMSVVAHTPHPERADAATGLRFLSLPELLATSDVVSLHCPLFPETQGIINRETIQGMKDGALLINTARGALIIENELAAALNSGKLGGAALDVVSQEPIMPDNPLLRAKNCILTPHIAWAPQETRARLLAIACDNLTQFLAGHPVNVVS